MLNVKNLDVFYDRLQALRNVSIKVEEGEFVAIIGNNGAGKTTLLKTISGLLKPRSGVIEFQGKRIDLLPPHVICEMGIIQVPEGRKLFPKMKVIENLELGAFTPKARKHRKETIKKVYDLFPILEKREKQIAGTLSGGQQQMLAIGRALMSMPQLLMLDEPSLGLAPKAALEIFSAMEALNKEEGLTILLVSQECLQALKLAKRAYVLENMEIVLEGRGKDLINNPKVKEAYLGI